MTDNEQALAEELFGSADADPEEPRAPILNSEQAALLKGKQLLLGRTKARVAQLTAELNIARQSLVRAEQTLGDLAFNDQETAHAVEALTKAQAKVQSVEAGLTVASQKCKEAQHAYDVACRVATAGDTDDALRQLEQAGIRFDRLCKDLEALLNNDLSQAIDRVKQATGSQHAAALAGASSGVELFLKKAARQFIPEGRAIAAMLGPRSYTDRLPEPHGGAR